MSAIKIDPEFRDLIPALEPMELEQLHKSLSASGCYTPLIVWKGEGILVDGHNRFEYCRERGIEFQTVEMRFSSRDVVKNWIILNQIGRRNVTPETASALRGMLYNGRKKESSANLKKGTQAPKDQNDTSGDSTAQNVAKETGVSPATIKRDAKLVDALNKLSIPVADWMAGKVKQSRKEIVAEAFPPNPKKAKPAPKAPETGDEPEQDEADEVETLVVDGTKEDADEVWLQVVYAFRALSNENQRYAFNAIKDQYHA